MGVEEQPDRKYINVSGDNLLGRPEGFLNGWSYNPCLRVPAPPTAGREIFIYRTTEAKDGGPI